jgi:hypothetical protein
MNQRTLFLAGGVLIVATAVVFMLLLRDSRQELSRTPNPDGTWTVVIGRERLLGLLGIEIIYAKEDAAGHVSGGSVKGQCSSLGRSKTEIRIEERQVLKSGVTFSEFCFTEG